MPKQRPRWAVDHDYRPGMEHNNHIVFADDGDLRVAFMAHNGAKGRARFAELANWIAAAPEMLEALEMIRDADEDCKRDGLPTIPEIARAKIDAAIAAATKGTK